MRASKYDQRITITRTAASSLHNEFGEDISEPTVIGEYWASVIPMQGRELESMQQRWADVRFKVQMRDQDSVFATSDVISWNERSLDILDVQGPGTRALEWTIYARDIV